MKLRSTALLTLLPPPPPLLLLLLLCANMEQMKIGKGEVGLKQYAIKEENF